MAEVLNLLARGGDLAVTIVTKQSRGQNRAAREQEEQARPEQAGRMPGVGGEANAVAADTVPAV